MSKTNNNKEKGQKSQYNKTIIMTPPNYFYLCILLNIALTILLPNLNLIENPFNIFIGIPITILGLFIVLNIHFLLEKMDTPENFTKSKRVATHGLFKYSRNPMYLGFVITLIGLSTILQNITGFISPILFFLIINFMFIPYEEEKMEIELGEKYTEYKKKIRRWL